MIFIILCDLYSCVPIKARIHSARNGAIKNAAPEITVSNITAPPLPQKRTKPLYRRLYAKIIKWGSMAITTLRIPSVKDESFESKKRENTRIVPSNVKIPWVTPETLYFPKSAPGIRASFLFVLFTSDAHIKQSAKYMQYIIAGSRVIISVSEEYIASVSISGS